jgi:hypothetical protein
MAGPTNLRLLTDFFNKIGPSRHFGKMRNLVDIGGIADTGQPSAPEDLWISRPNYSGRMLTGSQSSSQIAKAPLHSTGAWSLLVTGETVAIFRTVAQRLYGWAWPGSFHPAPHWNGTPEFLLESQVRDLRTDSRNFPGKFLGSPE